MSLANLGQKPNACAAFARLDRDFPSAPASVKERAMAEKQKAGC
jgi:TolA-binding protein